jgi:hypothetical protein
MQKAIQLTAILSVVAGVGCASASAHRFDAKSGRHYAQAATTAGTDATFSTPQATVDDAVARACIDVPEAEQRVSPLETRRVLAVEAIREPTPPKNLMQHLTGARVYILASPGLTREWLGHLLECHIARVSGSVSQKPDPLAVPKARVEVLSTTNGFLVTIASRDLDDARRILVDSEALRR